MAVRMYPNWCVHRHGARILVLIVFETQKSGGLWQEKQARNHSGVVGTHPAK
jgi:hypothetical protein